MPQIGITVPGTAPDATPATPIEFAQRADAANVHSVWVTDRLMFKTPDPFVSLGALAAVTSRARIGTTVVLGPLRPPLQLAKAAATVDYLSNGRLILGLGVGSRPEDFVASGVPLEQRGARMEELLTLARLAWSGQPIKHSGRHFTFDLGPMGLVPPQGANLPIWFGGGAEAVLKRVGRAGDGFIGSTSGGVAGFRERWQRIEQYAREAGRDPARITPAALIHFSVAADRDQAQEAMRQYLVHSYGARRLEAGLGPMAGTPDDLVAGANAYFEAGVEVLILQSITANPGHLDRLVQEVLPKLKVGTPAAV